MSITDITGTGNPQWVSLHYHNHDALCKSSSTLNQPPHHLTIQFHCSPPFRTITYITHVSRAGGDNRGGNNITLARYATLSVNGLVHTEKLRQPSGSTGFVLTQTVNATFERGGGNEIRLEGWNGSEFFCFQLLDFMETRRSLIADASIC